MQKQAILGLVGKAIGFTASKVVPKVLNAGYKGLVRPVARMALKRPGLALTGAIMPSWISGNMNTASQIGLSSLPRSLPKFASMSKIQNRSTEHSRRSPKSETRNSKQGDEMSDRKYPAVFYKIVGFEKMAAEAEVAHRLVRNLDRGLVKKGGWLDILKSITGLGQKSTLSIAKEEMAKALAKRLSEPDLAGAFARNIPEIVADYKNNIAQVAKEIKPKNLKEMLRGGSPLIGALAVGVPAYYYGHKAYKNYQENKALEDSYKNMLRTFPELQRENPRTTRQNFDYIRQYSPTVAKNPYAAGVIIKGVVAGRGIDQPTIKGLLDIEKVLSDSKPKHKGMLAAIGDLI